MEIIKEFQGKPVDALTQAIDNNLDYFDKNVKFIDLREKLSEFRVNVEKCSKKVEEIESFAGDYDFDSETPGNGYRSFVSTFESAVAKTTKICHRLIRNRGKILFRADNYADEIDEWSKILVALSTICSGLIETHQNSNSCLFLKCDKYDNIITQTLKAIDQRPFYGKNIGFQLCASMRPVVKFVVVSMACYFSFYFKTKPKTLKILRFPISFVKHHTMPKKRAEKCVHAYDNSTTEFCRSFWFLNEGKIMHPLSSLIATKIEVNKMFKIHPKPLQAFSSFLDKLVDVLLPESHNGLAPISCRLLSAKKRIGMFGIKESSKSFEPSKNLIFHVHGGGWAAQTSKSHETYLREWAVKLDTPILSVDYSLTPNAPFPRALEEIFYVYCWVLNNPELVGSTGENIVFVGDSAGGNLNTACVIKCIEMGIKKPKGLFNIYTPFSLDFSVSPARFLSLVDPILPYGFTSRLFKSYAAQTNKIDENDNNLIKFDTKKPKSGKPRNIFTSPEEEFNVKVNDSYLISPYNAPNEIIAQFPPTKLLTTSYDPCLDDGIEFGKRLRKVGVETSLEIVKGLPHGFLYFVQVSKESHDALMLCADKINSLF